MRINILIAFLLGTACITVAMIGGHHWAYTVVMFLSGWAWYSITAALLLTHLTAKQITKTLIEAKTLNESLGSQPNDK